MAADAARAHAEAARLLGLPTTPDEASLKRRFRELAKAHHPDRNRGDEARATEAFQRIHGASERRAGDTALPRSILSRTGGRRENAAKIAARRRVLGGRAGTSVC